MGPPTVASHARGSIVAAAGPSLQPTQPSPIDPSVSSPTPGAGDPEPIPEPTSSTGVMTEYERTLMRYLREDAGIGCAPRRSDLPPGATAAVECQVGSPLVDRVAVYGFMGGNDVEDCDQFYLDRAAFAYLDRMDRQGVLRSAGDCLAGTPQDVSWMGPEADSDGSNVYVQVDYKGRAYSVHRFGCFINEQGFANFRATCGEGAYVGVLGRTSRLDRVTNWALRWPDPAELSFPMPGICAGQHQITY